MAATVTIRRWTGASGAPTKNDITSIKTRLQASDVHSTAGTDNPVLIPASGTNYSYWAALRLSIDAITGGEVNNIKWFTDGANGLGTGVGLVVNTATAYTQATGTVGETGDELNTTSYPTLAAAPVDAFTLTSASPLAVAGSATAVGDVGDFVVIQGTVADTAGSGATAAETGTFQYDDTSS